MYSSVIVEVLSLDTIAVNDQSRACAEKLLVDAGTNLGWKEEKAACLDGCGSHARCCE